ncbi:uncharacterized protein LOC122850261 [Aphidius gifuensis]|uniref:uncharacterized protein LOC122850261 n=1 Tax=Aphidius gifuensis TaxID=684658 RepID=UPI001CDD7DB0|nr:uncharacterized protein LOC122850261 [Aphidius gifuensis]
MFSRSQSVEKYHNNSEEEIRNEDDNYSYSDESIWNDDFDEQSAMTNITARSSLITDVTSSFVSDQSTKIPERPVRCFLSPVSRDSSSCNQRRKNMSFTNTETMRIERDNQLLLRKIMEQQKNSKCVLSQTNLRPSSSGINRSRLQKKIEEDNLDLLRRIQNVKSSSLSGKKKKRSVGQMLNV